MMFPFATPQPTMTFELAAGTSGKVLAFVIEDDEVALVGSGDSALSAIADAIELAQADACWRLQHPEPCGHCESRLHVMAECPFASVEPGPAFAILEVA